MDIFQSFVVSVLASIVAYYLCKRLDGDEYSVIQPKRFTSPPKRRRSPESTQTTFGASFLFVLSCIFQSS